mmetsp:Transcript_10338/g.33939  ORF Transcript_10338/g.33939 Transcript_10338/m.33939 type:complete len:130 (-) Transcript_10338:105-494(-)
MPDPYTLRPAKFVIVASCPDRINPEVSAIVSSKSHKARCVAGRWDSTPDWKAKWRQKLYKVTQTAMGHHPPSAIAIICLTDPGYTEATGAHHVECAKERNEAKIFSSETGTIYYEMSGRDFGHWFLETF